MNDHIFWCLTSAAKLSPPSPLRSQMSFAFCVKTGGVVAQRPSPVFKTETGDSAVLHHVHPFSLDTCLKPPQHVDGRPRHAAYTSPQVQRRGSLRMTELSITWWKTSTCRPRPADEMEDRTQQQAWTRLVAVVSAMIDPQCISFLTKRRRRKKKSKNNRCQFCLPSFQYVFSPMCH